jgi:hypothetical protein
VERLRFLLIGGPEWLELDSMEGRQRSSARSFPVTVRSGGRLPYRGGDGAETTPLRSWFVADSFGGAAAGPGSLRGGAEAPRSMNAAPHEAAAGLWARGTGSCNSCFGTGGTGGIW